MMRVDPSDCQRPQSRSTTCRRILCSMDQRDSAAGPQSDALNQLPALSWHADVAASQVHWCTPPSPVAPHIAVVPPFGHPPVPCLPAPLPGAPTLASLRSGRATPTVTAGSGPPAAAPVADLVPVILRQPQPGEPGGEVTPDNVGETVGSNVRYKGASHTRRQGIFQPWSWKWSTPVQKGGARMVFGGQLRWLARVLVGGRGAAVRVSCGSANAEPFRRPPLLRPGADPYCSFPFTPRSCGPACCATLAASSPLPWWRWRTWAAAGGWGPCCAPRSRPMRCWSKGRWVKGCWVRQRVVCDKVGGREGHGPSAVHRAAAQRAAG